MLAETPAASFEGNRQRAFMVMLADAVAGFNANRRAHIAAEPPHNTPAQNRRRRLFLPAAASYFVGRGGRTASYHGAWGQLLPWCSGYLRVIRNPRV